MFCLLFIEWNPTGTLVYVYIYICNITCVVSQLQEIVPTCKYHTYKYHIISTEYVARWSWQLRDLGVQGVGFTGLMSGVQGCGSQVQGLGGFGGFRSASFCHCCCCTCFAVLQRFQGCTLKVVLLEGFPNIALTYPFYEPM